MRARGLLVSVWRRRRPVGRTLIGALAVALAVLGLAAGPSPAAEAAPLPPLALAWGSNSSGQLGNGATASSSVPVKADLPPGVRVTAVSGGFGHSLALTSSGHVYAWGSGTSGQLGNGTTANSRVPVEVHLPQGVTATAIAAGFTHSLAVTSTGQVYAWGSNSFGELGDGNTSTRESVPVRVDLPDGVKVTAVAAGRHSLARTSDGRVYAWGYGLDGALGNGSFAVNSNRPLLVGPLEDVTGIAAAEFSSYALTSTGQVYSWGQNNFGQLGTGNTVRQSTPVSVQLPALSQDETVTRIASANNRHALALTSDGRVLAWGKNEDGQLGIGNSTDSHVPVFVHLPYGVKATAIAAGGTITPGHSLALTSDGRVLAWGSGSSGQLGNEATADSHLPEFVHLPHGVKVTAIAGGGTHSLAIAEGPLVDVTKSGPASFSASGEELTYFYVIRDLGNAPLTDVTVEDSKAGRVDCPDSTLEMNESETCEVTYTTDHADVAARQIVNRATLAGDVTPGIRVSFFSNQVTVPLEERPYVQVAKIGPASFAGPNEELTYDYQVHNLGDVPLTEVRVTDSRAGAVSCPDARLPLGGSEDCRVTYTTTPADVAARRIVNTATLSGITPAGVRLSFHSNEVTVPFEERPQVQVAKTGPGGFTAAGQTLTYGYAIRNLGNVALRDVTLTDSRAGSVSCPDTTLPLNGSETCTARYLTTRADVRAGRAVNTATLSGVTRAGTRLAFTSNQVIVPLKKTPEVPVTG